MADNYALQNPGEAENPRLRKSTENNNGDQMSALGHTGCWFKKGYNPNGLVKWPILINKLKWIMGQTGRVSLPFGSKLSNVLKSYINPI